MESIPALTLEDVEALDGVLGEYLEKSQSDLAIVLDKGGNVIAQAGDVDVLDVTVIGALAAGAFAATRELARRIGEVEFNALYHQGNGTHMFMNSVDDDTIMITVFGEDTTVGLVRLYSVGTAQDLEKTLRGFRNRPDQGFQFDSNVIEASKIFEGGR